MAFIRAFSWGQIQKKHWFHSFSMYIKDKINPKVTQWLKNLGNKLKGPIQTTDLTTTTKKSFNYSVQHLTQRISTLTDHFPLFPLRASKDERRFYEWYQKGTCGIFIRTGLAYPNAHPIHQTYDKCFRLTLDFFASNMPCKAIYSN